MPKTLETKSILDNDIEINSININLNKENKENNENIIMYKENDELSQHYKHVDALSMETIKKLIDDTIDDSSVLS